MCKSEFFQCTTKERLCTTSGTRTTIHSIIHPLVDVWLKKTDQMKGMQVFVGSEVWNWHIVYMIVKKAPIYTYIQYIVSYSQQSLQTQAVWRTLCPQVVSNISSNYY